MKERPKKKIGNDTTKTWRGLKKKEKERKKKK